MLVELHKTIAETLDNPNNVQIQKLSTKCIEAQLPFQLWTDDKKKKLSFQDPFSNDGKIVEIPVSNCDKLINECNNSESLTVALEREPKRFSCKQT